MDWQIKRAFEDTYDAFRTLRKQADLLRMEPGLPSDKHIESHLVIAERALRDIEHSIDTLRNSFAAPERKAG